MMGFALSCVVLFFFNLSRSDFVETLTQVTQAFDPAYFLWNLAQPRRTLAGKPTSTLNTDIGHLLGPWS